MECWQQVRNFRPPAITTGLAVFLVLVFVLDRSGSFRDANVLDTRALTSLQIGRLSTFPLVHLNWLHLALNILALTPLLYEFEPANGTVRTGVVLNVTATVTALIYCALMLLIGSTKSVAGASAWVFTFLAYKAWKQYEIQPVIQLGTYVAAPTWAVPFVSLFAVALFLPGSSLLGHTIGLAVGYMLAMGYLNFMIEPPSKVILWIESKIGRGIDSLGYIVSFLKEIDAKEIRKGVSEELPTTMPLAEGQVLGRRQSVSSV